MKVRIKTWGELTKEFGVPEDTRGIRTKQWYFSKDLEKCLPLNRVITLEKVPHGAHIWKENRIITDDMIAEYLDEKTAPSRPEPKFKIGDVVDLLDTSRGSVQKWGEEITGVNVNNGRHTYSIGKEYFFIDEGRICLNGFDKTPPLLNKPPMDLVDLNFVAAMSLNMQRGIKGDRVRDDWKDKDWNAETESLYRSKLLRHAKDHDWAAVACNAMILFLRGEK